MSRGVRIIQIMAEYRPELRDVPGDTHHESGSIMRSLRLILEGYPAVLSRQAEQAIELGLPALGRQPDTV